MKKILLTGITGFIGKQIARELINQQYDKKYQCFALVRNISSLEKLQKEFSGKITFLICNLNDLDGLERILHSHIFTTILHVAAIRGTQNFSKTEYDLVNRDSTKVIAQYCLKKKSKLIYCSSVGVFGGFPECPASHYSSYNPDSYYHRTKIESEKILLRLGKKGLSYVVLRPTIVYGSNDYGFLFKVTSLLKKGFMILPKKEHLIHIGDVRIVAKAFVYAINHKLKHKFYIVTDKKPISLSKLVLLIKDELNLKVKILFLPHWFLSFSSFISNLFRLNFISSKLGYIAKEWYYETDNFYNDFSFKNHYTEKSLKPFLKWIKSL